MTSGQSEVSKLSLKYAKVNKKRRKTIAIQNDDDNIDEFSNAQEKNWQDLKTRDLTLEEILDLESNNEVTFYLLDPVLI